MNVCYWPHTRVTGWDGEVPAAVPFFPVTTLLDALTTHHTTDAHAVGYLIGDEAQQPRLNKGAIGVLASRGTPAMLWTVWVDLDRMNHKPWRSRANTSAVVEALREVFPLAGIYSTRAGARLVWCLDEGLPCSVANAWLERHLAHVAARWHTGGDDRLADLGVDYTSAQWTRCFRLPHVEREGAPPRFDPVVDLGPLERGETLTRGPLDGLASHTPSPGTALVVRGNMPDATPPPAWHIECLRGTPTGDALSLIHI